MVGLADLGLRSPQLDQALGRLRAMVAAGEETAARGLAAEMLGQAEELLRGRGGAPCVSAARRPALSLVPAGCRPPAVDPPVDADQLAEAAPSPRLLPEVAVATPENLRALFAECLGEALAQQEQRLRQVLDQGLDGLERRLDELQADQTEPARQLGAQGGSEPGRPCPVDHSTRQTVAASRPAGPPGDGIPEVSWPPTQALGPPVVVKEAAMPRTVPDPHATDTAARPQVEEVELILPGDACPARGGLSSALRASDVAGVPVARTASHGASRPSENPQPTGEYEFQAPQQEPRRGAALESGRPPSTRLEPAAVPKATPSEDPSSALDRTPQAMDRDRLRVAMQELLPELLRDRRIQQQLFGLIATECLLHPSALGELTGLRDFLRREIERAAEGLRRDAG